MNAPEIVAGSGRVLRIGGEDHRIAPLALEDFHELQLWVDRQFADPFAVADAAIARGDYTPAQQQYLYKLAMDRATSGRRLIGSSPEADELIRSLEGTVQLLWIAVRKAEPGFTEDDAQRLGKKLTFGDIGRVFDATGAGLVLSDPKAEAGTTAAGTDRPASTFGGSPTPS